MRKIRQLTMTLSQYFTKISEIAWLRDNRERLARNDRVVPLDAVLRVISALEDRIGPLTIGEDEEDN